MRLSKITTRTGDDGTTGLADGSRVAKDSTRITAIGSVDELNSHLGVLLAEPLQDDLRRELLQIQNDLFDLGAVLASPGAPRSMRPNSPVWMPPSLTTTPTCRRSGNSSCPAERVRPRCAMWHAVWRAAPNAIFCT